MLWNVYYFIGLCGCISFWNSNSEQFKAGKCSFYKEWAYNRGSCGYIPASQNIVALSPLFMPQSCGKEVEIMYHGRKHKAIVSDTCPSCDTQKIDLSDALFSELDSFEKGILEIEWRLVEY